MGSSFSCLLGRKADVSDEVIAEASKDGAVEEPREASIGLDKPHDSAESGTNSRHSSVRKSIPLSISLPDLTSISSTKHEAVPELALATPPRASFAASISRSESMARVSSVKDAARDTAMESALRNFEAKIAAEISQPLGRDLASAPTHWVSALPAEIEERGLNSAPALFSDAAMRNALRKIAAMQMKQDQAPPRSRGGSRGGSAKNSHRPSVDEEHQHNRADCTGPSGRAEAARPEFGWASQQVSNV